MKCHRVQWLAVFLLLLCKTEAAEKTISTKLGNVKGKTVTVQFPDGSTKDIAGYLGIPYGAPPVGDLRFEKPKPVGNFKGIFDASNYGLACPQYFHDKVINIFGNTPPKKMGEDCLNLDIYSPQATGTQTYPVMLYIFGGGSTRGHSELFNGRNLAAYGEVVVVVINYRVGVFGFLSTGDDNAPGNGGLWDQQLAIKWVKDNIDSFGGDNSRITIFGQSAGGGDVVLQAIFPGNHGLFHRAISQSGYWETLSKPTSLANARTLAEKLKCKLPVVNKGGDIVKCLKTVKNATLLAVASSDEDGFRWGPVVDDKFISRDEYDKTREYPPSSQPISQSFDWMIGSNGFDGEYVLKSEHYSILNITLPSSALKIIIRGAVVWGAFMNSDGSLDEKNAMTNAAMFAYTNAEHPNDTDYLLEQATRFVTDHVFYIPATKNVANQAYKNDRTKVYQYEFNHEYPILPTLSDWMKGATHGGELPFVFGLPASLKSSSPEITGRMWWMSKIVMDYWTNFAKTGNPNQPRKVVAEWKEYDAVEKSYLSFPFNRTAESGRNLHPRRTEFWLEYLPQIRKLWGKPTEPPCSVYPSNSVSNFTSLLYIYILTTLLAFLNFLSQ